MSAAPEEVSVLLMVHDVATRTLLHQHLQGFGYRVAIPELPLSALDKLPQRPYDVIVYDLHGGFIGLERLRCDMPDVPVIVLAHEPNTAADAVRVLKLGASDYLLRADREPELLFRALERGIIQGRQRRRERAYLQSLEQANESLRNQLNELRDDEEAGRYLQFQLLPPISQSLGAYRFSRRLWTSLYLSGDFIDYFRIDDNHTGFYMADVSGHGVSSAIVTVLLKTYMNHYLHQYRCAKDSAILDPARICARINRNILGSGIDKHLTMFYGVFNNERHYLLYCNAGQFPYPALYDDQGVRYIENRSKPLGLFDFAEYHNQELRLQERFAMVLASDGILEWLPQSKIAGKLEYLLSTLTDGSVSLEALVKRLGLDKLQGFPKDDVTLLLVQKGVLRASTPPV